MVDLLVFIILIVGLSTIFIGGCILTNSSPKEKNLKQLEVPAENIYTLLELANKAAPDNTGKKDYIAHCNLWAAINNIFPETMVGNWRWAQHGTQLFIIQTSKKSTF